MAAKSDSDKEEAEKRIDAIVYKLYGLTSEEVKAIEGSDKIVGKLHEN